DLGLRRLDLGTQVLLGRTVCRTAAHECAEKQPDRSEQETTQEPARSSPTNRALVYRLLLSHQAEKGLFSRPDVCLDVLECAEALRYLEHVHAGVRRRRNAPLDLIRTG